jgi:hydroxymethylpyrimidine pyrophosphatase-like HAD family hydrolase
MKPIDELTKEDLATIKMIVLDVDGVLVPRGTVIQQEGNRTMFETKRIAQEEIELIQRLHERGFLINISSGRGLYMLMDMFKEILPYVSLTHENGSATWMCGCVFQHFNSFNDLYDISRELTNVKDKRIKGWEPKEYIITIHCTDRVSDIETAASKHDALYCIWNGEAYDIGVKDHQTKAEGLKMLMKNLNLNKENVLAIGDNFNDKELVESAGLQISADKTRIQGQYYIPLPAETLMRKILDD